jgi:hypothetical protein
MNKCFGLASVFILLGFMFGISYGEGTGAESTDPIKDETEIIIDPEITGAKPLFWYDSKERRANGLMEEIDVLLQLVIRDKDGNLLAYIETTEKLRVRPSSLHWYLMEQTNKNYVMIDKEPFEVIHWKTNEPPAKKSKYSMAMYVLISKVPDLGKLNLVVMNHEAYQVEPGDRLKVYWTAFLPINPSS